MSPETRIGNGRRETDTGHCGSHEQQTEELHTLNTTVATMYGSQKNTRWFIGVGLPVAVVLVTATIGMLRSDVTDLKNDIKNELKGLNTTITNSTLSNKSLEVKVEQLQRDVNDIKDEHRRVPK